MLLHLLGNPGFFVFAVGVHVSIERFYLTLSVSCFHTLVIPFQSMYRVSRKETLLHQLITAQQANISSLKIDTAVMWQSGFLEGINKINSAFQI